MKTKDTSTLESPTPVGIQLQTARTRLGYSLEEVASRTRLHVNVLRHLESGRFDKLPSLAYTRGFLRIYARELGLDPKLILREFQPSADWEDSLLDLRPDMLESIPTRAAVPVLTSRRVGFSVLSLAALFIFSVAGIQMYRVWPVKSSKDPSTLAPIGLDQKSDSPAPATPSPDGFVKAALPVTPADASAKTPTAAGASSLPSVQVTETPAKPITPNQLQVRAKKDTWVRVVAIRDGAEVQVFEDTIDEDDMMPEKGDPAWSGESFVVTTRESNDLELIYNGSNFGTYEKPGPQTFRLPAR